MNVIIVVTVYLQLQLQLPMISQTCINVHVCVYRLHCGVVHRCCADIQYVAK